MDFIKAGYDLPFIAEKGLKKKDLDCVKIPEDKMGLRRKIMELYDLEKFYTPEEKEEDEEEEEEEGEDEEDEEEGEEEGGDEEDD